MKKINHLYVVFVAWLITFGCISIANSQHLDVTQKHFFILGSQTKATQFIESREVGKYKVIIRYKDFDRTKHKLRFHKQYHTFLMKVDNQEYYGTDGTIPFIEISSVSFFEREKEYGFPLTQYNLLFEPHLGKKFYSHTFSVKEHSSHIEINLSGGDGAGAYEVKWLVSKKSKIIKRQVSDILVLNEKKKPKITFSKLKNVPKK